MSIKQTEIKANVIQFSNAEKQTLEVAALLPTRLAKTNKSHFEAIDALLIASYRNVADESIIETAYLASIQLLEEMGSLEAILEFGDLAGIQAMVNNLQKAHMLLLDALNTLQREEFVTKEVS